MTVIEVAAAHGRVDYVTPEDIGEALASGCPEADVRLDVLGILGGVSDRGAEDAGLCAYVAWRGLAGVGDDERDAAARTAGEK